MPYIGTAPSSELANLDINGQKFILDADADTSITADTDDTIDIEIAGADDFQFTANTFTAKSGSTIAAQALTATTIGSSAGVTITGTTPTLTIGDAGAEDAAIVFDGNAQDFHIGLDDTADDLVIGLGSALGTTTHMSFTEDGEILKPLQPAFLVQNSAAQNNISVAGYTTIVFDSEILDVGANFASNTFTAPITGKYQINAIVLLVDADDASTYLNVQLVTSNRNYADVHNTGGFDADGYVVGGVSMLCDMDASDTAYMRVYIQGGSAQTDATAENSRFGGFLAC